MEDNKNNEVQSGSEGSINSSDYGQNPVQQAQVISNAAAPRSAEQAQASQSQQPQITDQPVKSDITPLKSSKKSNIKPIMIISIVLFLTVLVVGFLIYIVVSKSHDYVNQSQKSNSSYGSYDSKLADAQLEKFKNPTTGEIWYNSYNALPLQNIYNDEQDEYTKYYEVGKRGDNVIIIRQTMDIGTISDIFEKSPDGTFTAIIRPNGNVALDENYVYPTYDNPNVKVDTLTYYDSLSIPNQIKLENGEIIENESGNNLGSPFGDNPGTYSGDSEGLTTASVLQLGPSKVIEERRAYVDTGLTSKAYGINLPIKTLVDMTYRPIGTSFKDTTWENGFASQDEFAGIVRGCSSSSGGVSIGDNVTDADFVAAGKTIDGQVLFDFKDKNHAMVQKAYEETKQNFDYESADPSLKNVTIDQFMSEHAIFAYKSRPGEWFIYTSNKYAPQGGCAKPVVYLYPTTPTEVSVKVGADVKVSDPHYDPKSGWKVFALPNGQLNVNGLSYGSLFWEGPGYGKYPAIAAGTVVPSAQAEKTIRSQLFEQGLNSSEAQDFLNYWVSKIPNKPYVRLTWFNTSQVDRLAPLQVSPKPDTIIRVFLDMDGLDKPISIPTQKLSTLERKGFTLIEWGGLSRTKLY
ncbi:MAG: hypothetical protein U0451_00220 [Candidatus Saccharimonadales bacterium]